ncbi:class I SAM-dependent methyltransferase [Nocardioides sp. YIM 152315]|uniref:class I SAM-dependent methyltransferase n=1 Tax=Nocardioides sp. YIM 152315 TaxID=3031760 RepID=UPI0023DA7BFD|nr:class I SAM-dependent methyltransferase [Nocardioides sp. YIM 152315]MDF1604405.1 class I SAM-dependent methyltransferase [Nocardioides sp. YIM 152315]
MNQQTLIDPAADAAIKAKHKALWAFGDYAAVATEVIAALGPRVVAATAIGPRDRVIDVAAGSGNASLPAARAGAEVVASDLTPELLATGRTAAEAEGLDIDWREEDAERLPYDDGEFDAAISVVGVMFAPHHQQAADELVRVVRPGGRIGLISWTPEGFIGRMFATMKPYAPAPAPGAQPPPLWGDEAHVRHLLADRVTELAVVREQLPVDRFATAVEFREFFKAVYGPTIAVYRSLADDPARAAELDAALDELARAHDLGGGRMEWEYLLVTGRRA